MIQLRGYQREIISDLRNSIIKGNKRNILQLTTGGGKTIIFTYIAIQHIKINPFNKVLILTDRTELLNQSGNTFNKFDATAQLIAPKQKLNLTGQIFVGMVETVSRRRKTLKDFLDRLTLVIIDEAHKGNFSKLLPLLNDNCIVIGATATPVSTKNNRLDQLYNNIVIGADTTSLIEKGYLSNYRHYIPKVKLDHIKVTAGEYNSAELLKAMDKPELYTGLIKFYKQYAADKKTLIFCVNIEHAKKTAAELQSQNINALCLTSKNTKEERSSIIKSFESDSKGVLVNCGILTTGYDCPAIKCIILNRATLSLPLYMQMIGRGSRPYPGKDNFTVIDMGLNSNYHGLWNFERNWKDYFNFKNQGKKGGVAPVKTCPSCEAQLHAAAPKCEYCSFIFPVIEKEFQEAEELKEITVINSYSELPLHLTIPYEEMTMEQLIERAKYGSPNTGKPYKKSWITFQLKKRPNRTELIKKYANLNGYSQGWVRRELNY